jgi:DNA-binding response OmpR family regulator
MRRILLVDDDPVTLETVGALLRLAEYDVVCAANGRDAVHQAESSRPDVALVDLNLPDISGLDVLKELRQRRIDTACILVTGFATCRSTVDALRMGAYDCLDKPLFERDLLDAVSRALGRDEQREVRFAATEPHALTRWADAIVRLIDSCQDRTTLRSFGRAVGLAPGTFRNWCRTAQLSPRRSLLFARGLRAVRRQQVAPLPSQYLLNIVDSRTLRKFLLASGGTEEGLPSTVGEYLQRQQFIQCEDAVEAVRAVLYYGGSNGRETAADSQPAR